MSPDYFDTRDTLKTPHGEVSIYRLDRLEQAGLVRLEKLPFSHPHHARIGPAPVQ